MVRYMGKIPLEKWRQIFRIFIKMVADYARESGLSKRRPFILAMMKFALPDIADYYKANPNAPVDPNLIAQLTRQALAKIDYNAVKEYLARRGYASEIQEEVVSAMHKLAGAAAVAA